MNSLFTKAKEAFISGAINLPSDTVKAALVKSGYTPNLTTHQYYSDLTPASNVAGTPQTLASKTVTNGVFNAATVTFTAVASATINYIAIYKDTGTTTTSPLIALIDTATNLPATANGGDITVTWDTGANKIFALT